MNCKTENPAPLSDERALSLTVIDAPQSIINKSVQDIMNTIIDGRNMKKSEKNLDVYSLYRLRPPRGGAHPYQVLTYAPVSNNSSCVLMTNLADGWNSLCYILAKKHKLFQIQIKSSSKNEPYPMHKFEVWRNGLSVSIVYVMKDDRRWEFWAKGEVLEFERPERYLERIKKKRIDRNLLISYMKSIGWDITNCDFWRASSQATYFKSSPEAVVF